jgi:hypothetical protein
MEWYYTINGERKGPIKYLELKQMVADKILHGTDYVWNETMGTDWTQISSYQDLAEALTVPPLPEVIATNQPIESTTPYIRPAHLDGDISCTTPVKAAWERMKNILFSPFDMRKWFILAVSAWLATLGEGGSSYSSGARDLSGAGNNSDGNQFAQAIAYIQDFWNSYSNYIIIGAIVLTVIIIGIGLLAGWLKARGKFMLLDNVINNSAEISAPWTEFAQHAKSLFLWYIFFSAINMFVFMIIGGIGVLAIALPCIKASAFAPAAIPGIVAVSTITLLYVIAAAYIGRFVEDFIIPIMYNFDMTVTEAWHKFTEIFRSNSGSFIIYGLFYILLTMLSGLAVLSFMVATCCIGACLMMIPFVGTVVMLPVTIFFRAYSIEYLAQFGPDYICFEDEKA